MDGRVFRPLKRAAPHETPTTGKRLKPAPAIRNVAVQRTEWRGGSKQRVTWETTGTVPNVHIGLLETGGFFPRTIAYEVENTGSHLVTVPVGLVPGEYQLQVESSAARVAVKGQAAVRVDDEHRARCVMYARLLLGLPPRSKLPYPVLRKVAMLAATD